LTKSDVKLETAAELSLEVKWQLWLDIHNI
jgi:hypothetical protein